MADPNPTTNYQQDDGFSVGPLQIAAYMFAGLAMMLNIRLSYSAAPFALLRFKLPENLFSVFVRTTSSALELWCIPSMLIGNIMEQFYNHTQNNIGVHERGIKNKAEDIKDNARELKDTSETQSNSELGNTYQTDLQPNNQPQTGLETKANQLKTKAQALNQAAETLETAATDDSPLKDLSGPAGYLKTAAKKEPSGGTGLFEKAEALEQQAPKIGSPADTQATGVINAFEAVETNYIKLMDEYNKILGKPEDAAKLTQTDKDKVIEVVKAFHAVKNTFYQMLIRYRITSLIGTGPSDDEKILQKATELHTKADNLAKALQPKGQTDPIKEQLQKLAEALKNATDDSKGLQLALSELKTATEDNIGTLALEVITKYKEVKEAYEKVKARKTDYNNHAAVEYPQVKQAFEDLEKKFGPLKKSYENVIRLRVQELANKAENLKVAADAIVIDQGNTLDALKKQANALKDAASQPGSDQGLQQKATQLIQAINGSGSADTQATTVIQAFNNVTEKYNDLASQPAYSTVVEKIKQGQQITVADEQKVKNVYDAYKDLKKLYDKILHFTKIKHYSGELETAATGVNATNVITNFNAVVTVYKLLDDNKSIVESEFTELQTVYSKAIYFYKFCLITIPSMITNWLNFLTFVILLIVFVTGGENGHVTGYYVIMAISGFVFGINMVLVYAVDYRYLPFYMAGENSFPMVTSLILYFATSIFGNRRKYNSDYLVVVIDVSIAIVIAFVASVLWTVAFHNYRAALGGELKPIWPALISPIAMVIVGMGLVYSIYPGVAPGMIVPFYLIDKIEMVLLVATAFPPVIIAFLRKYAENWSPSTQFLLHSFTFNMGGWKHYKANDFSSGPPTPGADVHAWIWHFFDILIPLKISLAIIFIYSLHYRDSGISRAIINQPKMSTFLTILFYMCHEILLALGFPGMVGNGGAGGKVMLPVQYVGALLMVFLAFYSIGYITEYKRHDPSKWPTEGMTKWNALCYWLKMASKITNKNFKQLFTTDLLCDLVLCHKETKFIIRVKIN